MSWRLGLDIGTNSIGWAALSLTGESEVRKPSGLIGSGVRIFSDGRNPKDGQSNAVARRLPRQQRRMRDRYLKRRARFMDALVRHGLMPNKADDRKALELEDPWTLRVRGLDEELSLHRLGRALFHLQQRRGFKSNRKTDAGGDDESGKIKSAAAAVEEAMNETGARTMGELLAAPRIKDPKSAHTNPVRTRLKGSGAKAHYDFYPTRDLIEQEFNCLWDAQNKFHKGALTDKARDELHDILFFQRNLKAQSVGKCSLDPTEERAPKALPSVQRLRIYQEINHLTVSLPGEAARPLTLEERDSLVKKALGTGQLKFDVARNALKLPQDARFNLESEKRKHLDGDKTAYVLAGAKRWGKEWRDISFGDQETIVEKLLEEEDETALLDWLMSKHNLSAEKAEAVANAPLPDGHGQLGRTATNRVLAELEKDVLSYDKAVVAAGYPSHSQLDFDGEIFDALPYYGEVLERHVAFGTGEPADLPEKRYGKVANPTVHVALNQIRRVVNGLIKRFGPPEEIVVELARDLPLSAKGKSELERTQRENQNANDARRKILADMGQADSYENRLRLRLWEELNPDDPLDRRCPYTGEQISLSKVFSAEVEIEHILPLSRTLDDGIGNKTLSMRHANRFKGQQTPYEAFASSPKSYDWEGISARAVNLPKNKSWRFNPDSMDRYNNSERDFLARQLVDTRYMSRLATLYLRRTGADVWVTPGRFTSDLRWAWGLDSILAGHNRDESASPAKNRDDHRHHAIDAVVIALTDRGLLQHVATVAARAEERFDKRYLAGIDDPWAEFRDSISDSIGRIIVSHKPDHGAQGALHEDTAYGMVHDPLTGQPRLASRKILIGLTRAEIGKIGDLKIRADLESLTDGVSDKEIKAVLEKYGSETGVRRVRIHKVEDTYKVIRHGGNYTKAIIPGENNCVDIVQMPDGKWVGFGVSVFDANQKDASPQWKIDFPYARHIMKVRKNDLLKLDVDGREQIMMVVRLNPSSNRFYLAAHTEAGSLQDRHNDKDDPFRWDLATFGKLKARKARLVHVNPAGRLFDPGPPE